MKESKYSIMSNNFGFKTDDDSKTITLYKRHLKENNKKILELGDNMMHHIGYDSFKKYIKTAIEPIVMKCGYKVVFEYRDRKILILYNN